MLDVRGPDEFASGHVRGAINVVLHELPERLDQFPTDATLWVHCASGYRASIAAAPLDRHDRRVVLIDDGFDSAVHLGITSGD